jgi:hypothetical protein
MAHGRDLDEGIPKTLPLLLRAMQREEKILINANVTVDYQKSCVANQWHHSHLFLLCEATLRCYTAVGWGRRLEPVELELESRVAMLARYATLCALCVACVRIFNFFWSASNLRGSESPSPCRTPFTSNRLHLPISLVVVCAAACWLCRRSVVGHGLPLFPSRSSVRAQH